MFIVVEYVKSNTKGIIRESWLNGTNFSHIPSTVEYYKSIADEEDELEVISKWKLYEVEKLGSFDSLEKAENYLKWLSDYGCSTGEKKENSSKRQKRSKPADDDIFNDCELSPRMKKAKSSEGPKVTQVETIDPIEFSEIKEELEEVMIPISYNNNANLLDTNDTARLYSSNEIKHLIDKAKQEIISHFDKKFDILYQKLSLSKQHAAFQKLKSEDELKAFHKILEEDESFNIQMVSKLKSLALTGRHHSLQHGKIATFLEFIFDETLLPSIRYRDQPGKQVDGRIKLADYSAIVSLFRNALGEIIEGHLQLPETSSINKSIQNYFKHKLQKYKNGD